MNILELIKLKEQKKKITMVTCYDYTSAKMIAGTDIDCVLVGDSAAMVMHGHSTTIPATIEMMQFHTAAVCKGAPQKLIVADMPFLSNRKGLTEIMNAVDVLMKAGAHSIKIEGVDGHEDIIRHIVQSGVPVMGHLGLTPQSVHQLGGFKVQGREESAKKKIMEQAILLEELGCFAVVLECVPASLAKAITKKLIVPTIGIGAGVDTDGQVLVFQDLLGLQTDFKPKFVKQFLNGHQIFTEALQKFDKEVKTKKFPSDKETFQ